MARDKKISSSESLKPKRVPRFKSVREEAAFWEAQSSEGLTTRWEGVELKSRTPVVHVVEIEMLGKALDALDKVSEKEGIDGIALIYRWIEERLRQYKVIPEPASVETIQSSLAEAIESHRVVRLWKQSDPYGADRIVEPHVLYEDKSGTQQLNAYQTDGYSETDDLPGWRTFPIEEIAFMSVLEQVFAPRSTEGYNPKNRRRYTRILLAA
jgi:hypothetical protein